MNVSVQHADYVQLVVALLLQLAAIVIWFRLYGRIRIWSWWCCFFALVLSMSHRVLDLFEIYWFGHNASVIVSGIYVVATSLAYKAVKADESTRVRLKMLESERQGMESQIDQQKGAATALAAVLNDLNARISYYENQAKAHNLPLHRDSV